MTHKIFLFLFFSLLEIFSLFALIYSYFMSFISLHPNSIPLCFDLNISLSCSILSQKNHPLLICSRLLLMCFFFRNQTVFWMLCSDSYHQGPSWLIQTEGDSSANRCTPLTGINFDQIVHPFPNSKKTFIFADRLQCFYRLECRKASPYLEWDIWQSFDVAQDIFVHTLPKKCVHMPPLMCSV